MSEEQRPEEDLPHITLQPSDDSRTQDVRKGFGKFTFESVGQEQFRNMLGEVISVGAVIDEAFRNVYFLIDLTTEYYSPTVFEMLKSLDLEIKTVLEDMQIIVKGDGRALRRYSQRERIPKKITNPIRRIRLLSDNEKLGSGLVSAMKEDVDRKKTFPVSIRLIDNLDELEETELRKKLETELKNTLNPQYLSHSKQFICGASAKKDNRAGREAFHQKDKHHPKNQPSE